MFVQTYLLLLLLYLAEEVLFSLSLSFFLSSLTPRMNSPLPSITTESL